MNLTQKIIGSHLVSGTMTPGSEIGLRIDQTLTQDATGTMAWLQFEALGIPRVKTEKSVAYIDHNTLQSGFENADDHRFIQTVAKKHGIYFSRPGNGICHQVHLERFGIYVSSASACTKGAASHVLAAMGLPDSRIDSALRLSFGAGITTGDIDTFVEKLRLGMQTIARARA